MAGVKQYWEKYRERKKSPGGNEIIEGIISSCSNDRFNEMQGQINILEDRLVNLSRQFKMQAKDETYEMLETVGKINKIDKILEIKQMFDEKTTNIEKIIEDFTNGDWERKVERIIERLEKKITSQIKNFEERILNFEAEMRKQFKQFVKESKLDEMLNKKFDEFKTKMTRVSRSHSPDQMKRKLEDMSIVQDKLQKIVIDTAEKVKKTQPIDSSKVPQESSKFNKAVEKIGDLLKKYSKAQEVLFTNFKSLEAKTRLLEEKFDRSFAASEPAEIHRQPSFSSFDENFKISFGSEESHPQKVTVKPKKSKTLSKS